MLRLLGWRVVPVPFYDWERLQESRKQARGGLGPRVCALGFGFHGNG